MSLINAKSEIDSARKPWVDSARDNGTGKVSTKDKAYAAADILAAAIGLPTHEPLSQIDQGLQIGNDARRAKRKAADVDVRPSPHFYAHGLCEMEAGRWVANSPVTQAYLFSRAWKSVGGAGVSLGGSLLSAKTAGVNVGSAVRHGSAFLTTDAHLLAILAIARSSRKSATISQWVEVLIKAKSAKAALRGAQFAGAVTPIPLAGALVNIAAAAGKLGIKIAFPEMCYLTALEIHWRAYQEQKVAGRGKAGPASRIFAEMFTRRGVTALLGAYDVTALINESGGWMALGDKLAST